jgi:hypothetical protein
LCLRGLFIAFFGSIGYLVGVLVGVKLHFNNAFHQ